MNAEIGVRSQLFEANPNGEGLQASPTSCSNACAAQSNSGKEVVITDQTVAALTVA